MSESKKKVLFVSSFGGSSAYISEIIRGRVPFDYSVVGSGVGLEVFKEKGVKVDYAITDSFAEVEKVLTVEKPNIVFVISQFPKNIEQSFICQAKKHGVLTVCAIDHWSFYLERFSRLDVSNIVLEKNFYLPDFIIVNDEIAMDEAIDVGIPSERMRILGNPVLESESSNENSNPSNHWIKNLGLAKKKVIVFFSEEIVVKPEMKEKRADICWEFKVLEDILDVIDEQFHLIVKLHPSESDEKYFSYESVDNLTVKKHLSILDLAEHADYLVGMESMILLELSKFRDDVISYRDECWGSFIGDRLGVVKRVKSKEDLRKIFLGKIIVRNETMGKRFSGSRQRIVEFLEREK